MTETNRYANRYPWITPIVTLYKGTTVATSDNNRYEGFCWKLELHGNPTHFHTGQKTRYIPWFGNMFSRHRF
jgi:hypothetical protein